MSSPPPESRIAGVALGSNSGESLKLLRAAVDRLSTLACGSFRVSSLWRSSPVDCPPGSPDFLNAAVCFEVAPGATPENLLLALQNLEREFGRQPKRILNEPRPLDLDLIVFGRETRNSSQLTLPHPRARLRRFVLEPMAEILPGFQPPGWPGTIRETLAALHSDEVLERLPEAWGV